MKKIMFNDYYGLNRAVLERRKTNTRRVIKLKDGEYVNVVALDNGSFISYIAKDGNPTANVGSIEMPNFVRVLVPKYFIGEEVAVAQRYKVVADIDHYFCFPSGRGFFNKMFVRADLMPHRIKITNVRVERLQDISEEDCLKEGIEFARGGYYTNYNKEIHSRIWLGNTPKEAFATLIDKTCGRGTWNSNPSVFVYDFELVQ